MTMVQDASGQWHDNGDGKSGTSTTGGATPTAANNSSAASAQSVGDGQSAGDQGNQTGKGNAAGLWRDDNGQVQASSSWGNSGALGDPGTFALGQRELVNPGAITQDTGQKAISAQAQQFINAATNTKAPQAQNTMLAGTPMATAALGSAAQGNAAFGNTSLMNGAQGNASYGSAAQMLGAQQGYAQANGTNLGNTGQQFANAQTQNLNQLQQQANGQGPDVAGLQLKQGTEQQIASQMAILGSQRGMNASMGMRSAADQKAASLQALNQQQAVSKQQQIINAQNVLGTVAGNARGQSIGQDTTQAQLNQNTTLANQSAAQQALTNNASLNQATATQNSQYAQQMGLANLTNDQQTALQNMQNAQQANTLNQAAQNNMTQFNVGNQQNMNLANLNNSQATALANLGNQQGTNLANQQMQGQYGLQQGSMDQQTQMQNLAATLQQEGYNQQQIQAMMATQFNVSQTQSQQNLAQQNLDYNAWVAQNNWIHEQAAQAANLQQGYISMGAGAVAATGTGVASAVGAASDENLKKNISSGNMMFQSFMDQLQSYKAATPTVRMGNIGPPGLSNTPSVGLTTPKMELNYGSLSSGTPTASSTPSKEGLNPTQAAASQALLNEGLKQAGKGLYDALKPGPDNAGGLGFDNATTAPTADAASPSLLASIGPAHVAPEAISAAAPAAADVAPTAAIDASTTAAAATPDVISGASAIVPAAVDTAAADAAATTGGMIATDAAADVGASAAAGSAGGPIGAGIGALVGLGALGLGSLTQDTGAFAMSDERLKDAVAGGNRSVQNFLQQSSNGPSSQPSAPPQQMPRPQSNYGSASGYSNGYNNNQSAQSLTPQFSGASQAGGLSSQGGFQNYGGVSNYGSASQSQMTQPGGVSNQGGISNPGGTYTQANPYVQQTPTTNVPKDSYTSPATPIWSPTSNSYDNISGNARNQILNSNPPVYGFGNSQNAVLQGSQTPTTPTTSAPKTQYTSTSTPIYSQPPSNSYDDISNSASALLQGSQTPPTSQASAPSSVQPGARYLHGIFANPYQQEASRLAMSDEENKKNIDYVNPSHDSIQSMLDATQAHTYEYKDPKYGQGRQLSVMAQELEKSDLGKNFVVNTPEGKMVDYGKALGAMLAGQSYLNDKINKMENK